LFFKQGNEASTEKYEIGVFDEWEEERFPGCGKLMIPQEEIFIGL
jgi:hypothetical protein